MPLNQLMQLLRELAAEESRRAEISALAARHGIDLGSGELDERALDAIAGGAELSALSAELKAYLKEHPLAADTLSGVSQWWAGKQ